MRKCVVGFSVALVVSCVLSGVSAAEVTREEFNALKEKVDRLELKLRKMEERLDGFQTARVQGTEASAIRDQARRVNEKQERARSDRSDKGYLNIRKQRIKRLAGQWEWKCNGQKVATLTLKKDMTVKWKGESKRWELTDRSFEIEFKKGLLRATKAIASNPLTLRAIWEPTGKDKSMTGIIKKVD